MDGRYRGRGLGTGALRLAAEHAFNELELSLLELTVFPDNVAAIRSYEKAGFVRTDILRDSWELPDGTLTDMWVMELYHPCRIARRSIGDGSPSAPNAASYPPQ
jgi:diamine N-acetyltransferase